MDIIKSFKFLFCVGVVIHFYIVHIWFNSQVPKTYLPCILVCFRSDPPVTTSPTYLSTKGLVMFIKEKTNQ